MKKNYLLILGGVVGMLLTACGTTGGNGGSKLKYVDSVTIEAVAEKQDGFDAVVEPNKSVKLAYTYTPENATETNINWVISNSSCGSISTNSTAKEGTFNAKDEGEVTIYAEMPGNPTPIKSNELKIQVKGNFKKNADFNKAKTSYSTRDGDVDLNVNTLYKNQGSPHQDPLAENHILVIPFGFTDSHLQAKQTSEMIDRINTTFFGSDEEIAKVGGWESLQGFYKKSSYGKTDFVGQVAQSWCVYDGTASSFLSKNGGQLGVKAAEIARTWYMNEYAKDANHGGLGKDAKPIEWFDNNGDGYIDLIWIVYSQPTGDTSNWWAYVTYTGNGANKVNPTVKTLGFASIDWMQKSLNGYDPHTYIHETGHTFGLPDYYDYNGTWSPMGGIDFMDHNMGDHAMYSKFTLGWTSPLVVDEDAVITLRPGTTTGDCFIIPSPGYNGTAFDEYMMVELMAPVGLAERDYLGSYEGTNGYSEPGIRITHCDSRVYNFSNGNNHDSYLKNNPQEGIDYRLDNSYGGRTSLKADSDYFPVKNAKGEIVKNYMTLFSLMESVINEDSNWTKASTYSASNASLFHAGQSFTLSSKRSWAKTFMPSQSNLWNKAKTITGWTNSTTQTYEIDEKCTFNYVIKTLSIEKDADYGYVAKVQVTANAY